MKTNNYYPFSAVVGQDNIKKALILNLINPNIKGVLISGEKGTGKSTLVRGLSHLMEDMDVINLPLNITEDRLVGSIDINAAINKGKKSLEEGILKKAHNQVLYIDEVNLLSDYIVNILLEVASSNINIIEREGISKSHSSSFVLVGSMNPEEGILRSQFIDRFGLYVEAKSEMDIEKRVEIMRRFMDYEDDSHKFCSKWKNENHKLRKQIIKSKEIIKKIKITEENYMFITELTKEGQCMGHRADIILIETTKAISALDNRDYITEDDIKEAASYVLPHRIREAIQFEEEFETSNEEDFDSNNPTEEYEDNKTMENSKPKKSTLNQEDKETIEDISPKVPEISIDINFDKKLESKGSGKRSKVKADSHKGRYVKYRMPKDKVNDIAFDATFRIASYNQKNREENGLAISIRPEDIREKVREKHTGATILFLVDASGSMGARRRMGAVKGAVLSLLNDAYQKRDSIGIIAFRGNGAETLLNITRSVDLAEKCLRTLPTGGKTPLADGLYKSYQLLRTEKIKNPDSLQYLIVVSDGKANVPFKTDNALEDSFNLAETIGNEGIKSMVIDTESSYIEYGFAKELGKRMDSKYIKMSKISQEEIKSNIKDLINIK